MTSQGHPYTIFQRAVARRNVAVAWAAAHDAGRLSLVDALELVLLVRERDASRYDAAVVRWLSRFLAETAGVTADEAALLAAHLATLARGVPATFGSLAGTFEAHGRRELA